MMEFLANCHQFGNYEKLINSIFRFGLNLTPPVQWRCLIRSVVCVDSCGAKQPSRERGDTQCLERQAFGEAPLSGVCVLRSPRIVSAPYRPRCRSIQDAKFIFFPARTASISAIRIGGSFCTACTGVRGASVSHPPLSLIGVVRALERLFVSERRAKKKILCTSHYARSRAIRVEVLVAGGGWRIS